MNTVAQTPEIYKVRFNRSQRVYQVYNGRVVAEFPSGPANKLAAEWCAIAHSNLTLYNIARQMLDAGHDERRLVRAAWLVLEGKITHRNYDGDYTSARVTASDGNHSVTTGWPFYLVYHNLKWTCDCADYQINNTARCKHSLAVDLANRLDDHQQEQRQVAARKMQDWTDAAARRVTA